MLGSSTAASRAAAMSVYKEKRLRTVILKLDQSTSYRRADMLAVVEESIGRKQVKAIGQLQRNPLGGCSEGRSVKTGADEVRYRGERRCRSARCHSETSDVPRSDVHSQRVSRGQAAGQGCSCATAGVRGRQARRPADKRLYRVDR